MVRPNRIFEWCEALLVAVLGVGAARQEQTYYICLAFACGLVERRGSGLRVRRIGRGAVRDQELGHGAEAMRAARIQRGIAGFVADVDRSPFADEELREWKVAQARGDV